VFATNRSLSLSRFSDGLLLTILPLIMAACGQGLKNPAAPSNTAVATPAASAPDSAAVVANGKSKIDICHRREGTGEFIALSIGSPALDAHLAHGDALVGAPVPGQPGMSFDPACSAVRSRPTTITFAGLVINGEPVASYTEAGFTVLATMADWQARTDYGHPAPFIQFKAPVVSPTTGQITVTAGGSPFSMTSVDLYSSITAIPYVFEGFRNGTPVFTVAGTQPQTFGNFATVLNPRASDIIASLVIRLTNPPPCCGNPVGLDTIVVMQ
jgi:hypothetical protein